MGIEQTLKACGLEIIDQQNITPEVLQALDRASTTREAQIQAVFPFFIRKAICDFAAIKDTAVYNILKKDEMQYIAYLLQAQ